MAVTATRTGTETATRRTRQRQGARDARSEHIVAVRLAEAAYGIPVAMVHEIIHTCQAAVIPGSPDDVRGVLDLHGMTAPVLDLRRRLGLPAAGEGEQPHGARIVIVELDEGLVGLLVDGVAQVCRVPVSPRPSSPRKDGVLPDGVDPELTLGVGRLGRAPIVVLDVPKAARLNRAVAEYVAQYLEQAQTRPAA